MPFMDSIQPVYQAKAELAEGPIWYQNRLWWVNIKAGTLNCLNPESGLNISRAIGEYLGFAVPSCQDLSRWILGCHHSIKEMNWNTGKITTILSLPISENFRINDGGRDPSGNLWFGTLSLSGERDKASLYCLDHHNKLHTVKKGIGLSNGIDWLDDGSMLHVDSQTKKIHQYYVDDFKIKKDDIFFDFSFHKGTPDGLTVSKDNHVIVSMWGGGCLEVIEAKTRTLIKTIPLPVLQPSSCCLNTDQSILYVTSAWEGLSEETRKKYPENGNIFELRRIL